MPGTSPLGIYPKEIIQEKKNIFTKLFHEYFNGKEIENQGTPRSLGGRKMVKLWHNKLMEYCVPIKMIIMKTSRTRIFEALLN